LRDPLHDRGLADAGLAEQRRVVLRPPGEDLDRLIDLVGAAYDWVELAVSGFLRKVAAEIVQSRGRARLPRHARLDAANDRASELRVGEAEPLQAPSSRDSS
jgi:hypothetical protein